MKSILKMLTTCKTRLKITSSAFGRFSTVFPYLGSGKIRQKLAYVIGGFQTEAAF
jgi:hypothetical protein